MESQNTYRTSHIAKTGQTYDRDLENGALDEFMLLREDAIVREIVRDLNLTTNSRYLDFACGSGRILSAVAPNFNDVVAIDVSEAMTEDVRKKAPNAKLHIVDITKEALDIGKFDLITAFRFFGNAEESLRHEVLSRLRELIAEDGYLLINNHRNPASLLSTLSRHSAGMDLTLKKLRALLSQHGFEIETVVPIGAWILRHRWCQKKVWSSKMVQVAETLTNHPSLARFAPDMVILACPK